MSGYMCKYPAIATQSAVIYTCGPTIWVSLLSFSDMLGCNPSDADPANINPSDSSKKNSCRRPIGGNLSLLTWVWSKNISIAYVCYVWQNVIRWDLKTPILMYLVWGCVSIILMIDYFLQLNFIIENDKKE